ncbi:methyltransferase domain-containing protein [archaeon]|jgi:ubiquinone/menaquinone biosynthesis C-methylase UbiE|nr:methyltransferase domain-containing protein [archaeon]
MSQTFNSEPIKMKPEYITEAVERKPDWPWRQVVIYNGYAGGIQYDPWEDFPGLFSLEVHRDKFEEAHALSLEFHNLGPSPKRNVALPIVSKLVSICLPSSEKRSHIERWDRVAVQLPGDIGGLNKKKFEGIITQRSKGKVLEAMAGFNTYISKADHIYEVISLDYSREMLLRYPFPERKRILFDLNKISSEGIKMDFFGNEEFQTITCCYGVNYMDKPEQIFKEFYRILSPGGKFLAFGSSGSGYQDIQVRPFNPKTTAEEMNATGFSSSIETFPELEVPTEWGRHWLITGVKK